ncbi:gliding motility-associated C-terminal domain-containing protein [bacterium SCSIO 12741]|nr:gliding motility-associated C-terminal domain-containing protein [bacterium SCSIO 12741]
MQKLFSYLVLTLLLAISFEAQSQTVFEFKGDGTWKCSSTLTPGWNDVGFNDAGWSNSTAPSPNIVPGYPIAPGSQSMWLLPYQDTVYFRKSFYLKTLGNGCLKATNFNGTGTLAEISADNEYVIYVNGQMAGAATNSNLNVHNLYPFLQVGRNVIAIRAIDWNPPFMISFYWKLEYETGPVLNITSDSYICEGDTTTFSSTDRYFSYKWSDGQTTRDAKVYKEGKYWLEAVDSGNCTWVDTTTLTEYKHTPVDLGSPQAICQGEEAVLRAGNYLKYNWSTGDTIDTVAVNYSGKFAVTVTDGNGCSSKDSTTVTVFDFAAVNLGEDTILCKGETVELSATFPNSSYKWSTGSTDTSIIVSEPGTYAITITNFCGEVSDNIQVDYITSVDVDLGEDDYFCFGESYTLTAESENASIYDWSTGESTKSIKVKKPGYYQVTVYDKCGNKNSDEVEILKGVTPFDMIPTSFTPNGDGLNETWGTFVQEDENFEISIMDRWGQIVFRSNHPSEWWDGMHNGKECPVGNYFYVIKFTDCANQQESTSGRVTIVR